MMASDSKNMSRLSATMMKGRNLFSNKSSSVKFNADEQELEDFSSKIRETKNDPSSEDKDNKIENAVDPNPIDDSILAPTLTSDTPNSKMTNIGVEIAQPVNEPWTHFFGKIKDSVGCKLDEIRSERNHPKLAKTNKNNQFVASEEWVECSPEEVSASAMALSKSLSKSAEEIKNIGIKHSQIPSRNSVEYRSFHFPSGSKDNLPPPIPPTRNRNKSAHNLREKIVQNIEVESAVEALEYEKVYKDHPVPKKRLVGFYVNWGEIRECVVSWSVFLAQYAYRGRLMWMVLLMIFSACFISLHLVGFIIGVECTLRLYPPLIRLQQSFGLIDDDSSYYDDANGDLTPNMADNEYSDMLLQELNKSVVTFEGWMNEYCSEYNLDTYHISLTDPVHIQLQGGFMRLSNPKIKIPKRASSCDPPVFHTAFNRQRMYNIIGCSVKLLPDGLTYRKKWSRNYPICLTLHEKSYVGVRYRNKALPDIEESAPWEKTEVKLERIDWSASTPAATPTTPADTAIIDASWKSATDSLSGSAATCAIPTEMNVEFPNDKSKTNVPKKSDDADSDEEDGAGFLFNRRSNMSKLYLFARTDREKELWFRRLTSAVSLGITKDNEQSLVTLDDESPNSTDSGEKEAENEITYLQHMIELQKNYVRKPSSKPSTPDEDEELVEVEQNVMWANVLLGRLLFDYVRNDSILEFIQARLQSKLNAIRLPRFMECLQMRKMVLRHVTPIISSAKRPRLDDRGIWLELEVTFRSIFRTVIDTKLNLMKLKRGGIEDETPTNARKRTYDNSDIEESADSSGDEFDLCGGAMVVGGGIEGGPAGGSKMLRMVDRFAATKFFESMTENKYVKKVMEGVSNTELTLFVELRGVRGTLVLNIPPPPSDRLWYGFRKNPKLYLAAYPKIGETTFQLISNFVQKKLCKEFEKVFVLPNMDDVIVPGMNRS